MVNGFKYLKSTAADNRGKAPAVSEGQGIEQRWNGAKPESTLNEERW